MDRSILACCRQVDGATQTIAAKKTAQLSALTGRSCVQQKVVNCPLGTFSAPTLTAHTSLAPPRSLPSCSLSKAWVSEVRRATVNFFADKLHCPSRRLIRVIRNIG
ncbi:hypothetical protein TcG_10257 [Trypanosoma cruzi]|nr:hypothetical protein TcG_10257 [Trypanosoma cruzi]